MALACVALVGSAGAFARYRGLIFPVRIGSGSMAEQFLGPHYRVVCGDCRFAFRCGLDVEAPLGRAVCPNCGYRRNTLSNELLVPGERVLIDRWAYGIRAPRRGDVVAFVDPTNDQELAVKRIVGLPHERLRISGGELFIDGQLHRKELPAAREVAVLVYDDAFRHAASEDLPSRWRGTTSGWRPIESGFEYVPERNKTASGTGWLAYHHWRCYGSPADRSEEVSIADNYGYNQGLSRELHRVTDIWLSLRATVQAKTVLTLIVSDGRRYIRLVLSLAAGTAALSRDAVMLGEVALPNIPAGVPVELEYGILDRQVFLTVNDRILIWREYEPDLQLDPIPSSQQLSIGALSPGPVTVTNLQVFRDIYYLERVRGGGEETTLGADEYYLIGDNVPLSQDSRHWSSPGVSRNVLLGKVLKRRK